MRDGAMPRGDGARRDDATTRDDVAIVGMSCLFPGAADIDAYWSNILGKVDAVSDPPTEAWDPDVYYDPDAPDTDRVYCKRGGYLGAMASFDPLAHGIPPMAVGGEPDQWLALQLARDAMVDAGYARLDERVRQRTAVILGKGTYLNGGNATVVQHSLMIGQTLALLKNLHPEYTEDELGVLRRELKRTLPPMGPEIVPGLIPNIIVGRIANRLDLMGPSYTIDAACASSLIAVQRAMADLQSGECDLALVGGSQVWIPVATLNVFCRLGALSRRQQIRPFDEAADGTLLGEGIGMVVLKRLRDAERDGDRIYAVVKGVGVASDGRGVAVMAPRVEGEELALRRAYEAAGVSPATVGLIEAHGTGTPVGDVVEVQALARAFGAREGALPRAAIGSVKSMISHTMPAAGVAGLIKASLALYHKVLPPTLHCERPNPKLELEKTPFYVNTDVRPWVHGGAEQRRAGVNAFGFGGINAHVVLEEYVGSPAPDRALPPLAHLPARESEVCVLEAATRGDLLARMGHLARFLGSVPRDRAGSEPDAFSLADLAWTLNSSVQAGVETQRVAIVAGSLADLGAKLERAATRMADPRCRQIKDVSGIYFASEPLGRAGTTAFLFPGEGAQYPNMLADLCLHIPEVRACFDRTDRLLRGHPRGYLPSDYIFPRASCSDDERAWAERQLMRMDGAIEAVLTANQAILGVLERLGLRPDAIAGHSTGEYSAMAAAGILDLDTEARMREFIGALNDSYVEASSDVPRAVLIAVGAERERVEAIAREAGGDIFVAMHNCPHQAVLVGTREAAGRALELVRREGLIYESLTFDRAYHTRLFGPYADRLREIFARMPVRSPWAAAFSCTTAAPYPADPDHVRELMVEHWSRPVEFQRTIERLYDEGVRIFIEAGPRGNLTAFVEDILRGRPFCAVPANVQRRSGITQVNHLVAMLAAHGLTPTFAFLYEHRSCRTVAWEDVGERSGGRPNTRVGLSTAFPMMRISDEIARRFRRAPDAPAPTAGESRTATPELWEAEAPSAWIDGLDAGSDVARLDGLGVPEETPPTLPADPAAEADPTSAVQRWDGGPARTDDRQRVAATMRGHWQTMEEFLETQEQVMQAFLRSNGAGAAPQLAAAPGELDAPRRLTGESGAPIAGPTRPHLPPPQDPPSLGSHGPFGAVPGPVAPPHARAPRGAGSGDEQARLPIAPGPPPRAELEATVAAGAGVDLPAEVREPVPVGATATADPVDADPRGRVAAWLVALVSERTGYPVEMLDPRLDLEADLGIDSIKRVEIIGSFRERVSDVADADLERLATLRTLEQIVDALAGRAVPGANGPVAVPASGDVAEAIDRGWGSEAATPLGPGAKNRAYPLLGDVVSSTSGVELVAERVFDPSEDLYLRDHTLGRAASIVDPDLLALAVMPLTMSLEILAEAAAALVPGSTVVGMREVRAHRWVAWDDRPQRLRVEARRVPHERRVAVQLRNLTEDAQAGSPSKSPVIEATVVVSDRYPEAPAPRTLDLPDGRPSRWAPDRLYADVMFHGPSWQGVTSVDRTGEGGTTATLTVRPWGGFFRGHASPGFVLDPVVLDAAGQVIGFWTMEHLERGRVIFPFRLESLDVYGPNRLQGEVARCIASIRLAGDQQVRSDIDVVDATGRVWMRLEGWWDKRFDLPPSFHGLIVSSDPHVSSVWDAPISAWSDRASLQCRRVRARFPSDGAFWKRVWAQRTLSRAERARLAALRTPEGRQLEWLGGRAAAKEAVRDLLKTRAGLEVPLADIEIRPDDRGRPTVDGAWLPLVGAAPVVSLAHTDGWAVALAGLPGPANEDGAVRALRLGVDAEAVRALPDGFAETAFTDGERRILDAARAGSRDEWWLRAWCAKEAVAKALGDGLADGPRSAQVVGIDVRGEEIAVQLAGSLAAAHPDAATGPLLVHTSRDENLIVAVTRCEAAPIDLTREDHTQ